MIQSFFKEKPSVDTPYREIVLDYKSGWRARLLGGTKWGRENAKELRVAKAKDFDDGMREYDRLYKEVQDEGWKPYDPHAPW